MFLPTPPSPTYFSPSYKFLAQHRSFTNISIFSCCEDDDTSDLHHCPTQNTLPLSSKISLKQLRNKKANRTSNERSISVSKSKQTTVSRKISIKNLRRQIHKSHHNTASQLHRQDPLLQQNVSKSLNNIPNSRFKEINNSVHNFHTTNYIVGKCIVQPEETNIIIDQDQHDGKAKKSIEDEINWILNENTLTKIQQEALPNAEHTMGNHYINKANMSKKEQELMLKPEYLAMANFSFGQRQKKEFMSKYLNIAHLPMKQSNNHLESEQSKQSRQSKQSHRISKGSYEMDKTILDELQKINIEKNNLFLRGTFQNTSLNYFVDRGCRQIFKSESEHTQSKQSMVIDTHKSILSRMNGQVHSRTFL